MRDYSGISPGRLGNSVPNTRAGTGRIGVSRLVASLRSLLESYNPDCSKVLWHLGTHPKHERKGAGAQLIRWAFPRADAAGVRCYVDASKLGYPLYSKCGFQDVGELLLDMDEYEGGKGVGVQRWVAMVREPMGV